MDAHVSLEALERFKQLLTQFSKGMSEEAQKMQLILRRTYDQLQQKHYELRRQLQMCRDSVSYDRAKQQLIEFEFEGIFKTDYRTAHDKAVKAGRTWKP